MNLAKQLIALGAVISLSISASIAAESIIPKFNMPLPNVPGKSLIAVEVHFPPGVAAAPHYHPKSSFLYVQVLSGTIRSQVDDEPARTYTAGESWHEGPGAHHKLAENVSKTEPASLLAVFVVDSDEKTLVIPQAVVKPSSP